MQILDRIELAELIANTLKAEGFQTWFTPGYTAVRTDATLTQTHQVLGEVEYPAHLIKPNTSYSKGGAGEFITLIKTA